MDGRLRSVNQTLATWMGEQREDLIGRSVSSLILMPLPELLALDEERESELLPFGRDPIPVAVSIAPIHDRQGGAVGRVVSLRDLREQAFLQSHLRTAHQMATVGEMAAGIAHEVNNPVAYIQAGCRVHQVVDCHFVVWRAFRIDTRLAPANGRGFGILSAHLAGKIQGNATNMKATVPVHRQRRPIVERRTGDLTRHHDQTQRRAHAFRAQAKSPHHQIVQDVPTVPGHHHMSACFPLESAGHIRHRFAAAPGGLQNEP